MKNNSHINGFSLIELMITVAIVGILASIAYPSYQSSITKSRRADAKGALLGFSNAMERLFTETGEYKKAAEAAADTGLPTIFAQQSPVDGSEAFYILTIHAATANSYTLRATPTGVQTGDDCGNLELTNAGVKTAGETWCW